LDEALSKLKKLDKGGDAYRRLRELAITIDAAFQKLRENSCIQRPGLKILRDDNLYRVDVGLFHTDAKSQYKFPPFWREVRGVPTRRYSAHAIGTQAFFV